MSEQVQPKVGDRVRLTRVTEGVVREVGERGVCVDSWWFHYQNNTVEILPEPLPSEPNTFWLDCSDDVWRVNDDGRLYCFALPSGNAANYAPFRQLVLK